MLDAAREPNGRPNESRRKMLWSGSINSSQSHLVGSLATKGSSDHVCSLSEQLSEVVAKHHERGMLYNSLGTRLNPVLLFAKQTHCAYYDQINRNNP